MVIMSAMQFLSAWGVMDLKVRGRRASRLLDSPATLEELKGLYHGVVNPYPHQGCFRQNMAPQLGKLVAERMGMVKARPQKKAPGVSSITEGF
jgi:hypothetical protein